jgi:ubiquinone/menaquinone biosynthesis C-methylase UbiE
VANRRRPLNADPLGGMIDWKSLSKVIDVFSSEEYAPVLHQFYTWMVDRLDDHDLEPDTIVDLGCGTGLLSEKLVEWYPEAEITLVDSNRAMLDRARERLGDTEHLKIAQASAEQALRELANDSVEMMIFCRSWYALPDPDKHAKRAVEVLAPGGLIFLFDFTQAINVARQDDFYSELEPVRWPACRVLTIDFADGIREGRYRIYSEEEITTQWRAVGAELVTYESHEPHFPHHRMCFTKP